ncbi:CLOCK-interacting pacemaker-like isoform X2 [Thalassophryne amazonica]|nr:CLOCK-interacting pacemaker-like isoform X2 [Thalassophryne amazonica]
MAPYEKLTPLYVIKNLVVKPSSPEQLLCGSLAWSGGWHSLTGAKTPTQLLWIQQSAIPALSSCAQTSSTTVATRQGEKKKGGGRINQTHGVKNSYLPILNSFPRIAPHPKKESQEAQGVSWVEGIKENGSEGQSQSKRMCTEEEKMEAVSSTTYLPMHQQHQKDARVHSQYKSKGSHCKSNHTSSIQPKTHCCHQRLSSDSMTSLSLSSSQTPSSPSSDSPSSSSPSSSSPSSSVVHSLYCQTPERSSERQRRFLKTAEILNQSGLLAITLRTKELLKQNAAAEREIAQLRQHTHLLCQVAQTTQQGHKEGSDSLDEVLEAMAESGSYPNLNLNQLTAFSSRDQQRKNRNEDTIEKGNDIGVGKTHTIPSKNLVSLHNINDGISPPSPLFAPSPETEERQDVDDPLDPNPTFVCISFPSLVPEQGLKQTVKDKGRSDLSTLLENSTYNSYFL